MLGNQRQNQFLREDVVEDDGLVADVHVQTGPDSHNDTLKFYGHVGGILLAPLRPDAHARCLQGRHATPDSRVRWPWNARDSFLTRRLDVRVRLVPRDGHGGQFTVLESTRNGQSFPQGRSQKHRHTSRSRLVEIVCWCSKNLKQI